MTERPIVRYSEHLPPHEAALVGNVLYCGSAAHAQVQAMLEREARQRVFDPLESQLQQMQMDRWLDKEDDDVKV